MKTLLLFSSLATICLASFKLNAQITTGDTSNHSLYIDVHHIGPGKLTAATVAAAHKKDLAVETKYGVTFIKYWVDETNGDVYCLSSAPNAQAIRDTHKEAHGLMPDDIYKVTDGVQGTVQGNNDFYLDIHQLGPGNVTASAVAAAHQKDLAVEKKYGVNFISYWVDTTKGMVMCFSQAPDSAAISNTHKEAHGLIPVVTVKVDPGQ
jgi:hypothetical protein